MTQGPIFTSRTMLGALAGAGLGYLFGPKTRLDMETADGNRKLLDGRGLSTLAGAVLGFGAAAMTAPVPNVNVLVLAPPMAGLGDDCFSDLTVRAAAAKFESKFDALCPYIESARKAGETPESGQIGAYLATHAPRELAATHEAGVAFSQAVDRSAKLGQTSGDEVDCYAKSFERAHGKLIDMHGLSDIIAAARPQRAVIGTLDQV